MFALCCNSGASEVRVKSIRAVDFEVSDMEKSKDARGLELALVGWTTGKMVEGESGLSKESLLLKEGAVDLAG